jgi:hypothetical protein
MDEQPAADRWGLGSLPRTQFKSGWGTLANGSLSVRQIAVVLLPDGTRVGVSVAAIPADGSLETAQSALTAVATLIQTEAKDFPETC